MSVWSDSDFDEYVIEASNGIFSGTVSVYAAPRSAPVWADFLSGFPRRAGERRRLSCGASGPMQAGGLADLQFECVDSAGHIAIQVSLVSQWHDAREPHESAAFRIKVTAAAIDRFVEELRR